MPASSASPSASSVDPPAPGQRPLLVYDGDCAFCGYWARYWRRLTGDLVDYRPYQVVAAQYPEIPSAEFQRAVQYFAPDGRRASAAEASFLALSHAGGKGIWLALYKGVPGFATLSEWAYAVIGAHRSAFYRISPFLWGREHRPPRHELVSWLFLRSMGLIYLSLLNGGQVFMTYQWDTFLLEAGFLALLLSAAPVPGLWLLRWLLFRFMFMSGVVKLLSGDGNWWKLTALSYHFVTEPLPTPLAWYAALGILLLDDAALRKILPRRLGRRLPARAQPSAPRKRVTVIVGALALLLLFCSVVEMDGRFGGEPPALAREIDGRIEPLHIVNAYGLFAVMTTQRDEIVIEGSNDGVEWRAYEFRYKPGDPGRSPRWNIPHQPRLDWQMWFAALEDPRRLPWFSRLLEALLMNRPAVLALIQKNPFPDEPPVYVRAQFYEYRYADSAQKAAGLWWDRRSRGLYFPAVRLAGD